MKVKLRFFAIFALTFTIAVYSALGQTATQNPSVFTQDADHSVSGSFNAGGKSLWGTFGDGQPLFKVVLTYVSGDGSVSVCSATDTATTVYEYSADMRHIKTMRFKNEFPKFGAFTKDSEGSYYFFYGKDVEEAHHDVENMSLVKYDSSGKKVNAFVAKANPQKQNAEGVKEPFRSGTCRMEVSGDLLIVYFARLMFLKIEDGKNHQGSHGFVVNKNTFAGVDITIPRISHSWNQFILPASKGFISVNHGDYAPRCFFFNKVWLDERNGYPMNVPLMSFYFKEGKVYQRTFAQMGGIAETPDGYIFAGVYEKNTDVSGDHNDSRNMFLLTIDKEFKKISEPLWITNYSDKETENAVSPKIVAIDGGRIFLMWELMNSTAYVSTYMAIIDKTGKPTTSVKEIPGVRLNRNDVLRYNKASGNVYWAIDGYYKTIDVFSFNPDKPINVAVRSAASVDGYGLVLTDFVVKDGRTSVAHGEKFLITLKATKMGAGEFPSGQIGAALTGDKGNIVAVIGTRDWAALGSGGQRSQNMNNVSVPKTVAPGKYKLMAVARPANGEWKVVTAGLNGVSAGIDFTVR